MSQDASTSTQARDTDTIAVPYIAVSNFRRTVTGPLISSSTEVNRQLDDLRAADREHFVVFDLDSRHRLIERRVVHIGTLNGVEVHPREVFRQAIVNGAAAIILAHNHPSGDPTPSEQDLEITERLREVGRICNIQVLDHVVVAAVGFVSLAERDWR